MMKKYLLLVFFSFIILNSCNLGFSGTLGGGNVYRYNCDKVKLNYYLDSIQKNNLSLRIPENWIKYDDWDETGYSFLKGKIFYLKDKNSINDEMYFVSVIPPQEQINNNCGVAVRSVFQAKTDLLGWRNFKDLEESERQKIEHKFEKRVLSQLPINFVSIDK